MSVGCATVFITRRKKNQMSKNTYKSVDNTFTAMIAISIFGIASITALLVVAFVSGIN
jgi:hypothetical protein